MCSLRLIVGLYHVEAIYAHFLIYLIFLQAYVLGLYKLEYLTLVSIMCCHFVNLEWALWL